jgi:hypothetical protein
MRPMKKALVAAAAVAVTACSSTPKPSPQDLRLTFDPDAHASYFPDGTGEIRGQAFLGQHDEAARTCAGSKVIATPATRFFRQQIDLAAMGQMPLIGEAVGAEYADVVRLSVCGPDGSFSIKALPPGDWFVTAAVYRTVDKQVRGGLLVYKVRLHSKETVQIVMTDRDLGLPR